MPQSDTFYIVALDGSRRAEHVLNYVQRLSHATGATLILMRVAPSARSIARGSASGAMTLLKPRVNPSSIATRERQAAERYLERLAGRLAAGGAAVLYDVPVGVPQHALVREARKRKADLIALTTHGRGAVRRALLGSVADAVVRSAPCPVLVVR